MVFENVKATFLKGLTLVGSGSRKGRFSRKKICLAASCSPRPNAKRCWPFLGRKPNFCGITLLALTTSRLFVGVAAITTVWGLPSNSVTYAFPVGCSLLMRLLIRRFWVWPPLSSKCRLALGTFMPSATRRAVNICWNCRSNSASRLSRAPTTGNSRRNLPQPR